MRTSGGEGDHNIQHGFLHERNPDRVGVVSEEDKAKTAAQRHPFSHGRDPQGNPGIKTILRRPTSRSNSSHIRQFSAE